MTIHNLKLLSIYLNAFLDQEKYCHGCPLAAQLTEAVPDSVNASNTNVETMNTNT